MNNNKNLIGKPIKHEFLVPDYYKNFRCKGPDCRDSCCKEWKVTIPMQQYFFLHSLSCEKKVKDLIDKSFRPLYTPTPDRYAELVHLYNGNCPLLLENGYCLLHQSCGPSVLPLVCQYYPRSMKSNLLYECSCANSCEHTLELLFGDLDSVKFEVLELEFIMSDRFKETTEEEKAVYKKVRNQCFSFLNNRKLSLRDRVFRLSESLWHYQGKEDALVIAEEKFNLPEEPDYSYVFSIIIKLIDNLQEFYPRLTSDLQKIRFTTDSTYNEYMDRKEALDNRFCDLEVYLEKMLVNHLFYNQFPFNENIRGVNNSAISLIGIYTLFKYLTIMLVDELNNKEDLIDLWSRIFTVVAHSSLEKNLLIWFREDNLNDWNKMMRLAIL